jgi:hypothetical protein
MWDEEVRFPIYQNDAAKHRTLEVECFSKESRGEESVGKGTVDITDTLKTGEFDGSHIYSRFQLWQSSDSQLLIDWVPLSLNNVKRGEVFFEMTYYAAGPAPIQRRPSKLNPSERTWRPPQTNASPPATPPKGGSPQRTPPNGNSPRYGNAHLAPTAGGRLAPPGRAGIDAPLPSVPDHEHGKSPPGAVPPLLRPGNLASPPQQLHASKPLPPDHPVHAAQVQMSPPHGAGSGSLPLPMASPPITASAYPPAQAAPIFPAPPPTSLLPAGGAPPAHRTPSPGHRHAPSDQYQNYAPPSDLVADPGLGLSGIPSFPVPMPSPSPRPAAAADPIYDNNYNYVGPPSHPVASWGPARGGPLPSDPYGPSYHPTSPTPPTGYPVNAPPNAARTRPPFRDDYGSGYATPRAEVQPQYQPLFPQPLRQEHSPVHSGPPLPARHQDTQPTQPLNVRNHHQPQHSTSGLGSDRGNQQHEPPPRHPAVTNSDAQAAAELQRLEEQEEKRRKEQEERDLKLALELDREFNAPPEARSESTGTSTLGGGEAHVPGAW